MAADNRMSTVALLKALLGRAEADRDSAAAVLRQAEQVARQALAQGQGLRDYQQDFDQRWVAHFRSAGSTALLRCRQGFGQRLDQAITVQTANTRHLDQRLLQARALLLAREQRVAAVQKLLQRRQAELQQTSARRDQRTTDDAAQRARSIDRARSDSPV